MASGSDLGDVDEIVRQKARYGILVDRLVSARGDQESLEALVALFTPDARFDFGGRIGSFAGADGIRRFYGSILPSERSWIWHSFHSPCVDVSEDRATAQWTIYALAVTRGNDGFPPEPIYGRYQDRHQRVAGQWLQSELVFVNETHFPSR